MRSTRWSHTVLLTEAAFQFIYHRMYVWLMLSVPLDLYIKYIVLVDGDSVECTQGVTGDKRNAFEVHV